jgi:HSP90 family molecular chaperone
MPQQNCTAKMREWSSAQGLKRLRNSLLERNPSHQLVRKRVSEQGEAENSPKAYALIVFEQFVPPESCQVEGFG